jgi:hypothetical protein
MPEFPTNEKQVLILGNRMLRGFFAHSVAFPSIDKIKFLQTIKGYRSARESSLQTKAQAKMATIAKQDSLSQLKQIMKNCLKKSEVDVAGNPEKLAQIGWEPLKIPQSIEGPGQPNNLRSANQGRGNLTLEWDRPIYGGAVRNYIIQRRRQQKTDGEFGPWKLTATALQNYITLTNQPQKSTLEYHVKAVNISGESSPSNVIAVIL